MTLSAKLPLSNFFSKLSRMMSLGRKAILEIENEVEFILPENFDPTALSGWNKIQIKQAYPKNAPRARRSKTETGDRYYEQNDKLRLLWNKICIEQEKPINKRTFKEAWNAAKSKRKLTKDRYELKINDEKWCIDLFKQKDGSTYFVKAEVEMPVHRRSPKHIPNIVKENTLFTVPRADRRFSSRMLCKIDHAKDMMRWVRGQISQRNNSSASPTAQLVTS